MSRIDLINKISVNLQPSDLAKGLQYWSSYIDYEGKWKRDNIIYHKYNVESESSSNYYDVVVGVYKNKIISGTCTCLRYESADSCKHLAAVLYKRYEEIMKNSLSEEEISENILSSFYKDNKESRVIRKELKLDLSLRFDDTRFGSVIIPYIKIGFDKLYSLNNKLHKFYDVYEDVYEELIFGKNFIYNKDNYYFNEEDEKLIDFIRMIMIKNENDYYRSDILDINYKNVNQFFKLIKGRSFNIENYGKFSDVKFDNPYNISLSKKDNKYYFNVDRSDNIIQLCDKYVIKNGEFYCIPDEIVDLKSQMDMNHLNELVFNEDKLEIFSNGILKKVKDTIILDDSVGDSVIVSRKPVSKLYFDINSDGIVCKIVLTYGNKEINYFDNIPGIFRDIDYEGEIIEQLIRYHFIVDNNRIYMNDIDYIGEFFEETLSKLLEKYDVYTSQKLKETKFKDVKVKSSFGIGQDNIMSYRFDLDGISNDELVNILDNVKNKKRYYRLNNGDLINLCNNDDLNQLNSLVENMDLSTNDIKNGNGIIPKYRAIYLDSLKDKYNIIETNNLFDDLIKNFNSYKDAKVNLSKSDREILRDYQVVGVKWLYNVYKCGFGGILADEMGLGKSIQLIYFIKQVLKEKSDAKILIVAPTSLIYNWKNEFDKFGSELRYTVCAEGKAKREELLANIDDLSIIITTYGLIREDKDIYENINFEVIAIDEAQNIKNNTAQMTKVIKTLKGTSKFALTGTPLENSVMELWSIFDFIMPGYLTNLVSFQKKYSVKNIDDESLKILGNLKKQIQPFILRRKKKDVVLELPDKIENNIYLELNKEQKKIYVAELEKTQKEMDELLASDGFIKSRFKILQLLTKLRQICIDPNIIYENYKGGSTKIEQLVPLIKEIIANGHKILLFSSYKTAIDIVNRELTNNDISCYVIDGSVSSKKRMELVDNFNNDNTNVFLITLKAGGTGLNLTSADVVIHLDLWWNPQVENQATDRAHRIGQKNTVEVIKLICKGTIEERILELQNKKKILSDSLIEGDSIDTNIISKLSEKDIKRLLSMDNDD